MHGDMFYEMPENGSRLLQSNLFWNEPTSKRKSEARESFQAFACWNGGMYFGQS